MTLSGCRAPNAGENQAFGFKFASKYSSSLVPRDASGGIECDFTGFCRTRIALNGQWLHILVQRRRPEKSRQLQIPGRNICHCSEVP